MKTRIFVLLVAIMLSSCGAYYGSASQHEEGNWYLFPGSEETARIRQDMLAIEKLRAAPVDTAVINGVAQGYLGIIANLDECKTYNFVISGPETKAYLLGPTETKEDHLTPGVYTGKVFQGGSQIGDPWIFEVNVQQHYFSPLTKSYHWFLYMGK